MFSRVTSSYVRDSTVRTIGSFGMRQTPCLRHRQSAGSIDHLVELAFQLRLEVRLDQIRVPELGEGPAAVRADVVHARDPVGVHGRLLLFGVLAAVALGLDKQL